MASVNKVIIIGNLGKDPETRYTPGGEAVANITVATTESWKDKATGEKRESTEWHRISFFGKLAEIAGQYLRKGSQVYVEGSLRTRKWQDKDGQDRYTTEIRADQMKMLGGRGDAGDGQQDAPRQQAQPQRQRPAQRPQQSRQSKGFSDFSDDVPFRQVGSGAEWRVI